MFNWQLDKQHLKMEHSLISGMKTSCLAVLLILSTACSQTPNTSGIGAEQVKRASSFDQYLKTDNQEMAQVLSISALKSRTVNGLLEVNALLLSVSDKTQKLQYQFTWFDEQGFAVEANKTPWKSLSLHGGQSKYLKAVAPTPQASTFSVYVRGAHSKAYEFE